jgi:hypothetical protein
MSVMALPRRTSRVEFDANTGPHAVDICGIDHTNRFLKRGGGADRYRVGHRIGVAAAPGTGI